MSAPCPRSRYLAKEETPMQTIAIIGQLGFLLTDDKLYIRLLVRRDRKHA